MPWDVHFFRGFVCGVVGCTVNAGIDVTSRFPVYCVVEHFALLLFIADAAGLNVLVCAGFVAALWRILLRLSC